MSSEKNNINNPINPLLRIPAIPTFGIYDESSYLLMQQIRLIKCQNIIPKNLPPFIIEKIKTFSNKYPKIIPEFFHITLNANEIYNEFNERNIETNLVRINLVAHPYIFNNSKFSMSAKTHINCAIFKSPDEIDSLWESVEEENNIRINPNCDLIDPTLYREIILKIKKEQNKIMLEPNNCAFLLNLNNRITSFYCIIIGTHNNLPFKCFVGNYVIITNGINTSILNIFVQKLMNYKNIKDLFLSLLLNQMLYNDSLMFILFYILDKIVNKSKNKVWNIDEIKDLFINGYKIFFAFEYDKNKISQKHHEEDLLNICNYYFNHIKNYINKLYPGSLAIQNFSQNVLLCNINNKYIVEIIKKYIDFHLSVLYGIMNSYTGYFSEEINLKNLREEAKKIYKSEIWPKYKDFYCKEFKLGSKEFDKIIMYFMDKNWEKIENHNINIFKDMIKCLEQKKDIISLLKEIDEPIKEYFYYYIWVFKGKINGIHKNFGEYSFICNDKIKKIYHCKINEKLDFCNKMIEVITEADSQYNQPKDY